MNNYGSISLKNSSEISRNLKYPISATANSTINIRDGNLNLQNNFILTEATASNPSIAAARATAKAASMATSTITNNNYMSNYDPLEKSLTFQISTLCTIQRTKSNDLNDSSNFQTINSKIRTDTVKSLNHKMYTNDEIENIHVVTKPLSNRGTKFEKLRRELEFLEKDRNINYHHKNDFYINDVISKRLIDNSTHSNPPVISSYRSEQPLSYSISEPLNYSSDDSIPHFTEIDTSKFCLSKNETLNDIECSDSQIKKFKISDLKRNSKIINSFSHNIDSSALNINKDFCSGNKDINSYHCIKTIPGISCLKSLAISSDLETLMSNSSLLPETDIDSGTVNDNFLFPKTDLGGDQSTYSFQKTRSLVDLRKDTDINYQNQVSKAISTEDFKKSKANEECNLIKRLKSRAQSTQELRIADSLTKLNVPQWMMDFKLPHTQKYEIKPVSSLFNTNTMSYKNLKHYDNILSKFKYNSLPNSKNIVSKSDKQVNKILLPSSLYRSKSQNLVFFNPKEDSKLKGIKENEQRLTDSTNTVNLNCFKSENHNLNTSTVNLRLSLEKNVFPINYKLNNLTSNPKLELVNKQLPRTFNNNISVFPKDVNLNKLVESDEIFKLNRKESEFILSTMINALQDQSSFDEMLCESFGIDPCTLKLLLNVKRKTPNLNREFPINCQENENIYIENIVKKNVNNNNCVICNFKNCTKEILQIEKVDRGNCSCYNCFTYYCSKKCRNYDFSSHYDKCSFNRINKMLIKVKNDMSEHQLSALSKYALDNYVKYGEGIVLIAFESCRAADDFLNGQLNRLISQPHYFSQINFMKNISSFKIMKYDIRNECIIIVLISATLPMASIETSYPTFMYSFKLQYKNIKTSENDIQNERILTEEHNFEKFEVRKKFFDYILNFFKAKNVNLKLSHQVLYTKLEKYLNEGKTFESLTICIKDPILNSAMACTVSLHKEVVTKIIRNISTKSNLVNLSNAAINSNKSIMETEI